MVAGVRYGDRIRNVERYVSSGDPVRLTREPDNHHDANAILIDVSGREIGYVPRRDAAELAPLMDRGAVVEGRIKTVLAGGNFPIPVVVAEAGGQLRDGADVRREQEEAARRPRADAVGMLMGGCGLLALGVLALVAMISC